MMQLIHGVLEVDLMLLRDTSLGSLGLQCLCFLRTHCQSITKASLEPVLLFSCHGYQHKLKRKFISISLVE